VFLPLSDPNIIVAACRVYQFLAGIQENLNKTFIKKRRKRKLTTGLLGFQMGRAHDLLGSFLPPSPLLDA
jgi:ABC-type maltose transport system permease subunit